MKILLLAAALLVAGLAGAHELSAPVSVTADDSGHFAYDITIVITSPIEFAYSYFDGSDNTDQGQWHADGFCTTVVEPGTSVWHVEGNLVDPALDGSVYYEHAMCDGWTGQVTTVILAPVVATETVNWSALKARFR